MSASAASGSGPSGSPLPQPTSRSPAAPPLPSSAPSSKSPSSRENSRSQIFINAAASQALAQIPGGELKVPMLRRARTVSISSSNLSPIFAAAVTPKPSIEQQVDRHAGLFRSVEMLKRSSLANPLPPANMGRGNLNDVYITDFKTSCTTAERQGLKDVVFKAGEGAAQRSEICYGLGILIPSLSATTAPATEGTATVISSQDYNVDYLPIEIDGKSHLVNVKTVFPLPDPENDGTYLINNTRFKLTPDGTKYKIEIIPNKLEELAEAGKPFLVISAENKNSFIAPEDQIFEVEEHEKLGDFIKVGGEPYLVVEGKGIHAGTFTLKTAKPGQVMEDALKGVTYRKFDRDDPEDEDSTIEVLVPIADIFKLNPSSSVLTHEGIDFNVQKNDENGTVTVTTALPDESDIEDPSESHESLDSDIEKDDDEEDIRSLAELHNLSAVIAKNSSGQRILVPSTANVMAVEEDADGIKSINREEGTYTIRRISGKNEVQLIRREIRGMVQEKVENIFVGEPNTDKTERQEKIEGLEDEIAILREEIEAEQNPTMRNARAIGLREVEQELQKLKAEEAKAPAAIRVVKVLTPDAARQRFYDRISMPGFIEAFVNIILLRPQDAIIGDLDNSNILFQAIPNARGICHPNDPTCLLQPVLIDLDETFPVDNEHCMNPELTDDGKDTVHAVRNGLMAFPHSERKLTDEERNYAIGLMENIIDMKDKLRTTLNQVIHSPSSESFTQAHITATIDIIEKMESFIHDPVPEEWSLQDLFFAAFPEYKKQWESLANVPREIKAQFVGKHSTGSFVQYLEDHSEYKTQHPQ